MAGLGSRIRRREGTPSPPQPYQVPVSKIFEGNDGPWSSFTIRIDDDREPLRMLPSTTLPFPLIIGTKGCSGPLQNATIYRDGLNCEESRGHLYNGYNNYANESRQNNPIRGVYPLKNLKAFTNYGFMDDVAFYSSWKLGVVLSDAPTVQTLVLETYSYNYTWNGLLGIDGRQESLKTGEGRPTSRPIPSFLETLKNHSMIPSLSWGYYAGSFNLGSTGALGSLTLGGSDQGKYIPNAVKFPMNQDEEIALTLNVTSIVLSTSHGSYQEPFPLNIAAVIDTSRPYLYLPNSTCDAIAKTLNLTYNSTIEHYLISPEAHTILLQTQPSLSMYLSTAISTNDRSSVNITLPYTSLFLNLNLFPRWENGSGLRELLYFPMKRSMDPKQFTLGRAFLQDAYVIADYERKQFQVSQVKYNSEATKLETILPPAEIHPSHHLSKATIAGVAVSGAVLTLIVTIIFVMWRHKKLRKRSLNLATTGRSELAPDAAIDRKLVTEISTNEVYEVSPLSQTLEIGDSKLIAELPDVNGSLAGFYREVELDGTESKAAVIGPNNNWDKLYQKDDEPERLRVHLRQRLLRNRRSLP